MTDVDQEIQDYISPIWLNAVGAENALGIYTAIGTHAEALNASKYKTFFSLSQTLAVSDIVIAIYKIYDCSNKRYKKHTIPELVQRVITTDSETAIERIIYADLVSLNVNASDATAAMQKATASKNAGGLYQVISSHVPNFSDNPDLNLISKYRNKVGAHQECLSIDQKELYRDLPSPEAIRFLINWAKSFCKLSMKLLGAQTFLVDSCTSAEMAAKNVIAKVLDVNTEDSDAYLEFMGRS